MPSPFLLSIRKKTIGFLARSCILSPDRRNQIDETDETDETDEADETDETDETCFQRLGCFSETVETRENPHQRVVTSSAQQIAPPVPGFVPCTPSPAKKTSG